MITDDELLLYHYRELDEADRARIGAALAAQPELARRLHALVARLDAVAAVPEVAVPAQVQQRWQAALERATQSDAGAAPARRRSFSQPMWLAAAASVAVVALVFAISSWRRPSAPEVAAQVTNPATQGVASPQDSSAYANGLKVHLASTERRIASLDESTPEERARLIETIVAQNRIYALAAERAGEPQLARVLRAFNPILEDLAKGGTTGTADISQLSFELRVMQARLGAGAASTNTL